MIKNYYNVIGIMSGTSLDGVDLAHCRFVLKDTWSYEILDSETIAYPEYWKLKLKNLISVSRTELKQLDGAYTQFLAEIINTFILKYNLKNIDAVCSHGHTALHEPHRGCTYQIGNLPQLAQLTDQKVVCDFRVEDVALGGQGAPLVPIGDQLLFHDFDYCLNLGGFANISFDTGGTRVAYDICPVNIVMNHYVSELGLNYDKDGEIASHGIVDMKLLNALNALDFYKSPPPKSLGLEWVQQQVFPLIDAFQLNVETILRTFVEHIAIQISKIESDKAGNMMVTGGGTFNKFLMEQISKMSHLKITVPDKKIIDFKEALIFAFLGVLKLRGENNCLKSVTGATMDHCSGKVYYP